MEHATVAREREREEDGERMRFREMIQEEGRITRVTVKEKRCEKYN